MVIGEYKHNLTQISNTIVNIHFLILNPLISLIFCDMVETTLVKLSEKWRLLSYAITRAGRARRSGSDFVCGARCTQRDYW